MIKLRVKSSPLEDKLAQQGEYPYAFCVDEDGRVYAYYNDKVDLWNGPLVIDSK